MNTMVDIDTTSSSSSSTTSNVNISKPSVQTIAVTSVFQNGAFKVKTNDRVTNLKMSDLCRSLQTDPVDWCLDNEPAAYDILFRSTQDGTLDKKKFGLASLKRRYTKRKQLLKDQFEWIKRLFYVVETVKNLLSLNKTQQHTPDVPPNIHETFRPYDIGNVVTI